MDCGLIQAVFPGFRKGQGAQAAHAQGDIQISQAHIAVNAKDLISALGQSFCYACTEGGLTGAAFAGYDGDQFSQMQALLLA